MRKVVDILIMAVITLLVFVFCVLVIYMRDGLVPAVKFSISVVIVCIAVILEQKERGLRGSDN